MTVSSDETPYTIGQRDGIWAVCKPVGMAVHPTADRAPHLITWLDASELPEGTRPMHRLDLPTSGVVLCAADPAVRRRVEAWFAERQIEKRYRALVTGRTRKKGVIRKKLPNAKRKGPPVEAVTRWRTLRWLGPVSYLEARPETGRKHQIRQHFKGVGHPIVGDTRYGPRRFKPVPGFPGRLWLHALQLTLPDGTVFEAPLPETLTAHLALLETRLAEAEDVGEGVPTP